MQYYAFNIMSKTNLVHDYKYLVSREETVYPLLLFPGTTYCSINTLSTILQEQF